MIRGSASATFFGGVQNQSFARLYEYDLRSRAKSFIAISAQKKLVTTQKCVVVYVCIYMAFTSPSKV